MKITITLLLISTSVALADETLFVCDGETMETFQPSSITASNHQITMVISDNYVETSDAGRVELSNKDGVVWVWKKELREEDWLYNLDIISGKLKKVVTEHSENGMGRAKHIATYQCRKVEGTIFD